mgnify:CR=1 FL=1
MRTALHINSIDPKIIYNVPKFVRTLKLSTVDGDPVEFRAKRQMEMAVTRRGGLEDLKIDFGQQSTGKLEQTKTGCCDIAYSVLGFYGGEYGKGGGDEKVKEAMESVARVVGTGGRYLFVEERKFGDAGDFVERLEKMSEKRSSTSGIGGGEDGVGVEEKVWDVQYDEVDFTLGSFVAGVAIRRGEGRDPLAVDEGESMKSGSGSIDGEDEDEDEGELILKLFERGRRKNRKKVKEKK